MLEKKTIIDEIAVSRYGAIRVQRADLIIEDGVEIAKTERQRCFSPGADLTGEDEWVKAIAKAAWTPEVIAAYEAAHPPLEEPPEDEDEQ